ncbi:hypothetical protein HY970_00410 [Candidatus Kaiserbacteria bacterium]|nr:hypothetical protein [Candidatus Kaiserbacteria bacterium]
MPKTNSKKRRKRLWQALPPDDKEAITRTLLEAGYSCSAVGNALGTSKNAVVGFQTRKLRDLTGRPRGTLSRVPTQLLKKLRRQLWPQEGSGEIAQSTEPTDRKQEVPPEDIRGKLTVFVNENPPPPAEPKVPVHPFANEIHEAADAIPLDEVQGSVVEESGVHIETPEDLECTYEHPLTHEKCRAESMPGTDRCEKHIRRR